MRGRTLDPVTWENISASAITNNNVHDRQTQNYIETDKTQRMKGCDTQTGT